MLTSSLQASISTERLSKYLAATKGNMANAITLYEMNVKVSQILYGALHGYEITLRNALHGQLTKYFGRSDWYSVVPLNQKDEALIREALEKLGNRGFSPDAVIAELKLGFWTGLTAGGYQADLWGPCLSKAFPNVSPNRKVIHALLSDIKSLRNRVAHHERVFSGRGVLYAGMHPIQKSVKLYIRPEKIIECISWICADTAQWISKASRLQECVSIIDAPKVKELNL
jgi:hypothetical protein